MEFSNAQARRAALAAQGFGEKRPTGRVDRRHVRKVFDRIGVIQIDSVNVLVRSQELPLFARLGPHPRDVLPKMVADGELFEYWAHEASLLPVDTHSLFRWKMASSEGMWGGLARLAREQPKLIADLLAEVDARGPLAASDIKGRSGKSGPWWGWDHTKQALEVLFHGGHVSARRRSNFEREYDLVHRMLPEAAVNAPTPSERDARKTLLVRAAGSLGVGTAADLADYYRLNVVKSRPLLAELVEEGRLRAATVEGWKASAFASPDPKVPRWIRARALLSPFDSLIWERSRTERLFDFRYRLEIYVPAPKRVHGYYVLPFLLGDRLVARVDLKADRQVSTLRVRGAFGEDPLPSPEVAEELAQELTLLANWLGLDRVEVEPHGDLAAALRAAVGASG
jgi:Uncharacterized protein conserved in bacteria